jgi:hypothetical protein
VSTLLQRTSSVLRPRRREGCTRDTLRCDFWNWGPAALRPDCCTDHLLELTQFAHALLEREGIVHWLDYGTLLGAVRDGKFIPWDEDVDFGVFEADVPRILELVPEIEAAGHAVDVSDPTVVRIQYSEVNRQHVDLFRWHERDGTLWTDFDSDFDWPGLHDRTSFSRRYVERLEPLELYGRPYPAPSPAHDFLVDHRYGPDYMVPVRPVISVWLYPDLGPDDMTPTVKRMLGELADKDRRLAELNYRSRLGRLRGWQAWRNAGLPLEPPTEFLRAVDEGVPEGESTPAVEHLVYATAALDHAIAELERRPATAPLRRLGRRAVRVALAVAARLGGRPRRGFGEPRRSVHRG